MNAPINVTKRGQAGGRASTPDEFARTNDDRAHCSAIRLTKRILPRMLSRKRGDIVNVASLSAFTPGPVMATVLRTKAFLLSFSEALREERRDTVGGSRVTRSRWSSGTPCGVVDEVAVDECSRRAVGIVARGAVLRGVVLAAATTPNES
jgi:hypothetical protein